MLDTSMILSSKEKRGKDNQMNNQSNNVKTMSTPKVTLNNQSSNSTHAAKHQNEASLTSFYKEPIYISLKVYPLLT